MSYSSIRYSVSNRIAEITLNKPERRNALDDTMIGELLDAFGSANRNSDVRAVILTGSGEAFCAGMDLEYLKRYAELSHSENLDDARNLMKLLQLVYSLKKPVIAALNGPALGGGCGLAAACDFVFAEKQKVIIGAPEVRLGFLPALILLFLIKRMGEGQAKEFVLRGSTFDTEEAKQRGLITEIIDNGRLLSYVREFSLRLCETTSPSSVLLTKDLFSRFGEMGMKDALEYAANLNALTRKTDDFKKGIESFIKKEKLRW